MKKKNLRSGYTTGACAAAAAKAAVRLLFDGAPVSDVEIPFPDGSRISFELCRCLVEDSGKALASVVKDAGDDPDVTNGAEIVATARRIAADRAGEGAVFLDESKKILLRAGVGVGMVTKPGLVVSVGEPAINPVPRRMIYEAVCEALAMANCDGGIEIVISVPAGESLAKKTLNHRLGIIGGLSILGTTGIVKPISSEAWTATIAASLSVARAAGLKDVVLATGRTSERAVQSVLDLPDEAYAMMGDYLEFSLQAAKKQGFARVHLAGMGAKIMKAALKIPQSHVRHGALAMRDCLDLLAELGAEPEVVAGLENVNTAREIYERLLEKERFDLVEAICRRAKNYAEGVCGLPVTVYLITGNAKVITHV